MPLWWNLAWPIFSDSYLVVLCKCLTYKTEVLCSYPLTCHKSCAGDTGLSPLHPIVQRGWRDYWQWKERIGLCPGHKNCPVDNNLKGYVTTDRVLPRGWNKGGPPLCSWPSTTITLLLLKFSVFLPIFLVGFAKIHDNSQIVVPSGVTFPISISCKNLWMGDDQNNSFNYC